MIVVQCLFTTIVEFQEQIKQINQEENCLVQIYTSQLLPDQSVQLANDIRGILPKAQIIGTSANAIIYKGEQYREGTLIVVEQFKRTQVRTNLIEYDEKTYEELAEEICEFWGAKQPRILRLFVGACYDYSHQLIEKMNKIAPKIQIVGGVAGEVCQPDVTPYVFNANKAVSGGLIYVGLESDSLYIYNRINTAHETISPEYTITAVSDRAVLEIEEQPAQSWLQKNIGFLSTKQYESWEDIADNDPLVRFQLALSNHKSSIRFVRYDEPKQEITQYFSRLEVGTKFRLSYTSPARCVEECKETCLEIKETPIEHLFCYNCLFRKLYLENCAKWELTPYHDNPVSGVFLLGEFGYSNEGNALLNGSCVMSGIAEEEKYLTVDMGQLNRLDALEAENEGLLDFIIRKQGLVESPENKILLGDVISRETEAQKDLYIDPYISMDNMLKYEKDKDAWEFDKLCLIKIDNADVLMSYMGQAAYFSQVKTMVDYLIELRNEDEKRCALHIYSIKADTFVIASNSEVSSEGFVHQIRLLEVDCKKVQDRFMGTPFLMRFVIVCGEEFLLEQAYSQLQLHQRSQSQMIVGPKLDEHKLYSREEIDMINTIRYAIAEHKVIPYYQGLHNNVTKRIDKYEALMRIEDEKGHIIAPFFFMNIAKKYRLYLELNLMMFEAVLDDFSKIDCSVNINLSAHDIASTKFRQTMRERLEHFHNPKNITFEIIEDEYFTDMDALNEFIKEVREFGVKIAIDDFGAGYSNLLEITKIQPDYLKVDGAIIKEIHSNYKNEALVEVAASLGRMLDIDLVAEYVENEQIQKKVEEYGIMRSQGYHFSKPQPFEKVYAVERKLDDGNLIIE